MTYGVQECCRRFSIRVSHVRIRSCSDVRGCINIIIRGAFELQGLYFQASSAAGVIMFLAGGVVALYPARAHTVSKIERKIDELGKEIKEIKRMLESLTSTYN